MKTEKQIRQEVLNEINNDLKEVMGSAKQMILHKRFGTVNDAIAQLAYGVGQAMGEAQARTNKL